MVVVVATFVASIAPWPELSPQLGNAPTSAPAVLGICFFASFFALCLEWSTRIDCRSRLEGYE
ncbi:MAG TPA: hypothetical protein VGZ26_02205, partial [Pirellulales bacterium]|nr:hypothetical protein [Pirellulales bacterium]